MRKFFLLLLFATFSIAACGQAHNIIKEKYRTMEIGAFTIEKGVELPPDVFAALPQEIVSQLQESKLFDKVLTASDATPTGTASGAPVLRMTGVVTAYHPGSRKGRYFGGSFNPGAFTQIYAYVDFVDAATNVLIGNTEVVGTLSGGLGGGNSKNVVQEFAGSLVETTKFTVLKPPLPSGGDRPKVAEDSPHETVELSESTFDSALSKLNDLAAKGYRLIAFRTTSYQSANLILIKTSDTAQYQYLFVKAILPTSVQKELTRRSAEGYRYQPHTMIMLKNHVFVIAERDSKAPPARYEYRVHATMLISSAENNIREDQAQGFSLIDCRKTMENHHMLMMEKHLDN